MSTIAITNAMNMIVNSFFAYAQEVSEERWFNVDAVEDLKQLWEEEKEKIDEAMKNQLKEILPAKKSRTKKSKNAPKNPKSAYVIFCQEKREEVKKANPEMPAKEIMKELGKLWKATEEEDRGEFQEKAKEDKERYTEEMKNYVPSEDDEEKPRKKRVKKTKNAPKNASGPYIFFCKEEREKLKEEMPELSAKEIMAELGKRWKEIKETKKADKYKKMAEEDKVRYAEEMENYVPSEDDENEEKKKTRKPRAKKPKDAPKNVRNAYMFYCEKNRDIIKKKNPELKAKEITAKLADEWKKIKDTSKAKKYTDMVEKDKKRHEKEMEEYNQKKHLEVSEDEEEAEEEEELEEEPNKLAKIISDIMDDNFGKTITKRLIKKKLEEMKIEFTKEEFETALDKAQV